MVLPLVAAATSALASGGVGSMISSLGAGALASGIGGGIDRYFDKKAMGDQLAQYQALGLTPQEIMGGGGLSGAAGSPASAALGNQAAQKMQQERQMAYDALQRQADRDNALEVAQVQTAPANMQAALASALNPLQMANLANTAATGDPEFVLRRLMLSVGPENAAVNSWLGSYGFESFDDMFKNATPAEMKRIAVELRGLSSVVTETLGSGMVGGQIGKDLPLSFGASEKDTTPGAAPGVRFVR